MSGSPGTFAVVKGSARSVPDHDLIMLQELFHKHDSDHSGTITLPELEHILGEWQGRRGMDGNKEDIGRIAKEVMLRVDRDGSGAISFREFLSRFKQSVEEVETIHTVKSSNRAVVRGVRTSSSSSAPSVRPQVESRASISDWEMLLLRGMFGAEDSDGDAGITHDELNKFLITRGFNDGGAMASSVFHHLDKDSSGNISFVELLNGYRNRARAATGAVQEGTMHRFWEIIQRKIEEDGQRHKKTAPPDTSTIATPDIHPSPTPIPLTIQELHTPTKSFSFTTGPTFEDSCGIELSTDDKEVQTDPLPSQHAPSSLALPSLITPFENQLQTLEHRIHEEFHILREAVRTRSDHVVARSTTLPLVPTTPIADLEPLMSLLGNTLREMHASIEADMQQMKQEYIDRHEQDCIQFTDIMTSIRSMTSQKVPPASSALVSDSSLNKIAFLLELNALFWVVAFVVIALGIVGQTSYRLPHLY
eukprot:TRINITY_DN4431_c0_g1_i1.p1 TRINITY_DN4431_c0_g1~~TRINITY_DN4431_c0_g1_i1.p1  ORF type:complete len:490 (+),score=91.14 TRINITY_DN4431_c0_g1_i1:40-1470(+)